MISAGLKLLVAIAPCGQRERGQGRDAALGRYVISFEWKLKKEFNARLARAFNPASPLFPFSCQQPFSPSEPTSVSTFQFLWPTQNNCLLLWTSGLNVLFYDSNPSSWKLKPLQTVLDLDASEALRFTMQRFNYITERIEVLSLLCKQGAEGCKKSKYYSSTLYNLAVCPAQRLSSFPI